MDQTISRRALLERAGKLVICVGAGKITATSLAGCGPDDEGGDSVGMTTAPTGSGTGETGGYDGSTTMYAGDSTTGYSGPTGGATGGGSTGGSLDYLCDYDLLGYDYCCRLESGDLYDYCCALAPADPASYECAYDVPPAANVGERHVLVD